MAHEQIMNKASLTILSGSLVAGNFADQIHDWKDLDAVLSHVTEARKELNRAAKENHYDMAGHAAKAEQLLGEAERELSFAEDSAKAAH
jgi:hypothetical protein